VPGGELVDHELAHEALDVVLAPTDLSASGWRIPGILKLISAIIV